MPALIEKSITNRAIIASHIVNTSFYPCFVSVLVRMCLVRETGSKRELTDRVPLDVNIEANGRVKPKRNMARVQIKQPTTM